jgi:divalent metal cation (Fe/Co/Zn/Cd) transporter
MWGFGVIVLSIIIDFSRSRALNRAAKKHRSQALEADALHFSSDVWSSLVVLAGLVFVSLGQPLVDAVAAIVVAALVLVVSYRMGRRTIEALMDRMPEGLEEELHAVMRRVEGVSEIRGIRLRQSGSKMFLDTTVAIPRTMLFHQAHDVMDNIERSVRSRYPEMDVIVHGEPFERNDETIAERIRMIILARGLAAPHHLEVHQRDDRYQVEFDVEFSKEKDFVEAHDITTEIEREIRDRVPVVDKVTIHMEEYQPETSEVGEETGREADLRERVSECIRNEKRVVRFADVNLLKIGDRYNLSVTCGFDRGKTLGEIHEIVSEVEKRLYDRLKELRRVTIHAEPS